MSFDIMDWKACEKDFVRKVSPDLERVESIKEMALLRLEQTRSMEVSEKSVSFIVENYYEVIKELLVAYLLKNGLRSKNHQCLISYFYKENPGMESEAVLIKQMSFFRNRLDYYGEKVPFDFYESKKGDIEHLVDVLFKIVE